MHGTIRNLDDHAHDYRLVIELMTPGDTQTTTLAVGEVGAGETVPWSSSVEVSGDSVRCEVTDVFGPLPFGVDPDS